MAGRRIARQDAEVSCPAVSSGFRARANRTNEQDRNPAIADAVAMAKCGDRQALHYLYDEYADSVYGYVLSILHDPHDAEDVTQNVFIKLVRILERYEPREVPFAAWIVRVARNAAIDHIRESRQIPCEEVFGPDESADESHHERRRCLADALAELPEDQRNVVVLRHLVGLSPVEIAAHLDRTTPSIHGLHHRGRAAIQQALRRLDAAPSTAA